MAKKGKKDKVMEQGTFTPPRSENPPKNPRNLKEDAAGP